MGLLDMLGLSGDKPQKGMTNINNGRVSSADTGASDYRISPLSAALLTYATTGQGYNPVGAALQTYMSASRDAAEQERQRQVQQQQQAMMQRVSDAFANNAANPQLLANYAMSGGEGASQLIDMYKFGRTPQSFDPGKAMIDPITGRMSMPMPKMGEGQVWRDGRVQEAAGYGDVMRNQINRDLQKYQAQEGIGYGYDVGRINEQARADVAKYGQQQDIGYGYDVRRMGAQAQLDPMSAYDPATGRQVYATRGQVAQGGYMPNRPQSSQIMDKARAERMAATESAMMDGGARAAQQMAKLNQLAQLAGQGARTGALTPLYQQVGGIAQELGINIEGLSETQQSGKVLLQLAQDIPLPPGAASNVDVMQRLQQLPQQTDTPDAYLKSVQAMQELADLNMFVSEAVREAGGLTPALEAEINQLYAQWGKGG